MAIEAELVLYIAAGAIDVYCTVGPLKLDALGSFETSMTIFQNIQYINQDTPVQTGPEAHPAHPVQWVPSLSQE